MCKYFELHIALQPPSDGPSQLRLNDYFVGGRRTASDLSLWSNAGKGLDLGLILENRDMTGSRPSERGRLGVHTCPDTSSWARRRMKSGDDALSPGP
jgi:hypothetical protein